MKFDNPYIDVPKDQQHKTTVFFDVTDISDLQKMHPRKGVVQTMVAILTVKLLKEIRSYGNNAELVRYNPKGLEQLIATASIKLDPDTIAKYFGVGSPVAQPSTGQSAETVNRNVGRGTAKLPRSKKKSAAESPDASGGGQTEEGKLGKYK